jgi:hypothetical protein
MNDNINMGSTITVSMYDIIDMGSTITVSMLAIIYDSLGQVYVAKNINNLHV